MRNSEDAQVYKANNVQRPQQRKHYNKPWMRNVIVGRHLDLARGVPANRYWL